jgi:hypothetical protein
LLLPLLLNSIFVYWTIDAVMATDLLTCTICPKQPVFSDTSHLLTHVSSKGHLSHLHKLQVRSHQEIAAGVELASYNQWYQHHGLGKLLSERMLLKEERKANKRANAARRGATLVQHDVRYPVLPLETSVTKPRARSQAYGSMKTKRGRTTAKEEDEDSDFTFSPIKRSRFVPLTLMSGLKR